MRRIKKQSETTFNSRLYFYNWYDILRIYTLISVPSLKVKRTSSLSKTVIKSTRLLFLIKLRDHAVLPLQFSKEPPYLFPLCLFFCNGVSDRIQPFFRRIEPLHNPVVPFLVFGLNFVPYNAIVLIMVSIRGILCPLFGVGHHMSSLVSLK